MRFRALSILTAAVFALISSTACGGLFEPAAAVVNGKKITVSEVQRAVDDFKASAEYKRLAQQGDSGAIVRDFEQSYVSTLIRRRVLVPTAEEMGIEVTAQEVQDQLDDIKAEFRSDSEFQEALKEQGLTLEQLELLVRDRALEEKLREAVIAEEEPSEAELRAYYEDHLSEFEETETSHILVRESDLAARLSQQLRATPPRQLADVFARLAKQHSRDRSNKDLGGALGFNRAGQFVPAFEEAAAALDVGEVSRPVKTRFGWHVIWVEDRRPAPFDAVEDEVQTAMGAPSDEEIFDEWVRDVYIDAGVKVNPRYGEFNVETQQVEDVSARTVPGAEETPRDVQPSPSVTAP